MGNYDPNLMGEYDAELKASGKTQAEKAEELGISLSTFTSALRRYREREGKLKKKERSSRVTVVNVKENDSGRSKSLSELLNDITFNVDAIKKVLGVK